MKILSSVFLLIILFSCSDWPLLNPIDPESPNYIGQLSKDLDGDGIGQYADVDDITLIGPEDGAALSADDVLTITPFKAGLVSSYRIQIATDKDNFSASTIVFQDDSRENKISLPPLTQAGTYYWRAKAYDGSKWSDSWSEARSFTISYSGGIDIDSDMDDPLTITLSGNSTVYAGSPLVVSAVASSSVDSYTWYLDGEKLAGETARTITISQGQEEGLHTLTLIVQAGAVYASEDFVFEVVSMPTEGLVAYYPFNGNANDESGNGHDGTLGGDIGHDSPSLTADRFEKANSAYKFDAYREMIKLPANIVDGKSNISLAFWIKAADPNSAMGVITGSNSSRDNEYLFMIHSGGNIYGIIKNQEMYGNTIIADNTWHLFVVTRNSDGSVKYYVDGTLDKSASLPSGNLSISDGGLWLGNEQDSVGGSWDSSQQLKGILDDIRIYSRALSQEEIGVLFSAESGSEGIRTVTGLSPSYTQDTATTLSWEAVANAVRYEVQFAPTEEGVEYITATSVADTTYTPSSTLVKDQTYYWRVRAVDSDGKRGAWSAVVSLSVGLLFSQTNLNLELIEVKGGSFQMGSTASDAESNESPVHQVTLSDFAISKYEITFEQYDEYCDDTGVSKSSDRGWGRGTRPVIYVTWYDAAKFCNWLSGKDGLTPAYSISGTTVSWDDTANGWRLPTEAEWEYAARGGNASKGYLYAGSDNADEVGWYSSNSGRSTHPVGGKAPNELGLYDMSGNVWEWCWDWHGTYSSGSQSDPKGPASGSYRVDRGGSWYDSAGYLRSAFRGIGSPGNGNYNVGFRLVRREF